MQQTLIWHFGEFRVSNKLIRELREKYESQDDSLTLSFDSEQNKHYWRQGGAESARSLVSSFNDRISEIHDEKDSTYLKSQSFLNALFPRQINKQYQVANEGKRTLNIKIEKKP